MHRLYLLSIFILTDAKWHQQINGYHKPTKLNLEDPEAILEKAVNHLRIADKLIIDTCNDNNARETYDSHGYILKYSLQRNLEDFVSIKIKNKVMLVNVKLEGDSEFTDVKILPPNVETSSAIWWIENDVLIITMPYIIQLGEDIPLKCEKIEDLEVDVPLRPEYSDYQFLKMNTNEKPVGSNT